jgi:uncharacterized protein involved in exopolysaccharide biosynthesis
VITYALLAGAAGAGFTLLLPNVYISRAAIVADTPERPGLSGSLAQFAGQFGMLGLNGSRSPEFYRDLLRSRRVLTALAATPIFDPDSGRPEPVYRVYSAGRIDSLTRGSTERILKVLSGRLETAVDVRTGVIRVALGGPTADQAREALDSLLSLTNQLAVTNLRSRGRARREFAEAQVTQAREGLQVAEDSLRRFYEGNRRVADSPRLQFEEARLRRRVDLRQQLYVGLSQELEQSRIDEVRDTPILNIIDPPAPPNRHEQPQRRALTMLAAFLGGVLAVGGLVIERARSLKR